MKTVILVRHAIAEPSSPGGDAARRLSGAGTRKMERAAEGLVRLSLEIQVVLASPLVRAHETAVILAAALGLSAPETLGALAPGHDPEEVWRALKRRKEDTAALVGHEPGLSLLASFLLTGPGGAASLDVKKGSALALACSDGPGNSTLLWMLTPRQLRRLAG